MKESKTRESYLRRKKIIKRSIRKFGVTRSPREAGYILPDGRMLDFQEDPYSHGRDVDHREIANAFSQTDRRRLPRLAKTREKILRNASDNGTSEMIEFMDMGNIRMRFAPYKDSNDLLLSISRTSKPTEKQLQTIRSIAMRNRPSTLTIDVEDETGREISVGNDIRYATDVDKTIKEAILSARARK